MRIIANYNNPTFNHQRQQAFGAEPGKHFYDVLDKIGKKFFPDEYDNYRLLLQDKLIKGIYLYSGARNRATLKNIKISDGTHGIVDLKNLNIRDRLVTLSVRDPYIPGAKCSKEIKIYEFYIPANFFFDILYHTNSCTKEIPNTKAYNKFFNSI